VQQLRDYGERKKKEEGSLHWAALYAGLFSLSAKYIKKKKKEKEKS
jgi:hypothetical protein